MARNLLLTRMCQTLFCIVCWINFCFGLIKPSSFAHTEKLGREEMLIVIVFKAFISLCAVYNEDISLLFENCDKVDNDNEGNKQAQIYVCLPQIFTIIFKLLFPLIVNEKKNSENTLSNVAHMQNFSLNNIESISTKLN